MEPAIEEFNLLYPNYLISSIDGSVEVVETCPRSDLDFRRLVVTGCMGMYFRVSLLLTLWHFMERRIVALL